MGGCSGFDDRKIDVEEVFERLQSTYLIYIRYLYLSEIYAGDVFWYKISNYKETNTYFQTYNRD